METLLNPFKKKTITLTWFKTVDKLPAGSAFGERALLKNEDRAATIVCSKDCTFATLHRKDYNSIIGAAVKRELKQKVDFLRGFRMFSQLRTNIIERIHYFMKTKTFLRGQKVYMENISTVDGIYFITQGEFEISQLSVLNLDDLKCQPQSSSSSSAGIKYKSQQNIENTIKSRMNLI